MKDFQIEKESRGPVQIIRLNGSLDMYSFPRLEAQLNAFFRLGQYLMILDCRNLEYIGSAGLGALIALAKQAREHNGDLRLLNLPERIYKVIELLGFTKVLQVFDSEEAALASFQTN
ncbi:MAG TPA: STAS domain-containing protein [Verrucomicrobiae bacterium]|nr:STAS domain-containing protein [Verrucomicrobiae bacterium]